MPRRTRYSLAVLALSVAVIAALIFLNGRAYDAGRGRTQAGTTQGRAGDEARQAAERDRGRASEEGEAPGKLGAHLEALREAIPGNGGEPAEGPGSAEADAYFARAYPAKTISLAKMRASKSAYQAARARLAQLPNKLAPTADWARVGPERALYPLSPFRNSTNYVPNAYVASGRTTSIAISNVCQPGDCRMWVTPAGGGIWRTDNALLATPAWTYLGGPLGINAAGDVTIDPNDASGDTIYVGTGEGNICGSGCVAGVGLYKSTNGGGSWRGPMGARKFQGKGLADVVVKPGDPDTIYVATTTALRGHSSVCCDGVTRPVPGVAKWGLYRSVDGGQSWQFVHNGSRNPSACRGDLTEFANNGVCSPRGVRNVVLDPSNPDIVYASSYARGVWRSRDGGDHWTQIKASLNPLVIQTRPAIAVTRLPNGKTRMYVYEGNVGTPTARLFRSDDVASGTPVFQNLSSPDPADPGYGTYDQCGGQCWYDEYVYTPAGHPDVVYTGGSYGYGETGGISNGRAVMLSTDAGVSSTDMTMDATDEVHPNGLHPDQHALVTDPRNPYRFFATNDGGLMRSSGTFADASSQCADRDLAGPKLARCQQLLSRVPARLRGLNNGLGTLQFQSLSVAPFDSDLLMGGTQDNGTWQSNGNRVTWRNIMVGDGGQSGFAPNDRDFRFHTFYDASPDVNFNSGAMADWIWTGDPIYGQPGTEFYVPIITDPTVNGTMFVGTGVTVYRTKTFGLGTRSLAEAQRVCNEFTGTFQETCGDWVPAGPTPLTSTGYGSRGGGAVAAVERTTADNRTAWAATTTGRVFVTKNADAQPASSVLWNRIDTPFLPNRFVSSIYVDAHNGNRAWVSYSGYNASTPTTPGHVFRVVYHPGTGRATWADLSHNLQDLPITDLVRDDVTGDLYASSDFGVLRLAAGSGTWTKAADGMPSVEVPGLTILPRQRILYAASHGLGAWRLDLD